MTIPTAPEGWTRVETQSFGSHVGPFFQRPAPNGGLLYGFQADDHHANKRGVTHGGMIATAFDVALGNACWDAADQRPSVTVTLSVQYVGALPLGAFAELSSEIVRVTATMVFARGVMRAGGKVIATADGIWKILTPR